MDMEGIAVNASISKTTIPPNTDDPEITSTTNVSVVSAPVAPPAKKVRRRRVPYGPMSMGFLGLNNPLRRICINMIMHWTFEVVILFFIFANAVFMAIDDGSKDGTLYEVIGIAEYVFLSVFTLEVLINWIAMGLFMNGSNSYFRSGWNTFDFLMTLLGILSIFTPLGNYTAFRAFRAFRALRSTKIIPGMKILMTSLISTIPGLGNVVVLLLFVFFLFALLGMQVFGSGKQRYRCYYMDDSDPLNIATIWDTSMFCGQEKQSRSCPDPWKCGFYGGNPSGGLVGWDNFLIAMVTNVIIVSKEGWSDIMYQVSAAVSPWTQIYFLMFEFMCGVIMMNMVTAVVFTLFEREKQKEMMKRHEAYLQAKAAAKLLEMEDEDGDIVDRMNELSRYDDAIDSEEEAEDIQAATQDNTFRNKTRRGSTSIYRDSISRTAGSHNADTSVDMKDRFHGAEYSSDSEETHMAAAPVPTVVIPRSSRTSTRNNSPGAENRSTSVSRNASGRRKKSSRTNSFSTKDDKIVTDTDIEIDHTIVPATEDVLDEHEQSIVPPHEHPAVQQDDGIPVTENMDDAATENDVNPLPSAPNVPSTETTEEYSATSAHSSSQYWKNYYNENGSDSLEESGDVETRRAGNLVAISRNLDDILRGYRTDAFDKPLPPDEKNPLPKKSLFYRMLYHYYNHVVFKCHFICSHPLFKVIVVTLVFLNCIFLATMHERMSPEFTDLLAKANFVFFGFFAVEALIKIIGLGPRLYVADAFNCIDFFVLIVSIIDITLYIYEPDTLAARLFRGFRVQRIFKFIRVSPFLQSLLKAISMSMADLTYFVLLMALMMFVVALIGMQLFRNNLMCDGEACRPNFDNFGNALMTVFQLQTAENFNDVMVNAAIGTSYWASIYFIIVFFVGNIVIMAIFVSILLSNVNTDEQEEEVQRVLEQIENEVSRISMQKSMQKSKRSASQHNSENNDDDDDAVEELDPMAQGPIENARRMNVKKGGITVRQLRKVGLPQISLNQLIEEERVHRIAAKRLRREARDALAKGDENLASYLEQEVDRHAVAAMVARFRIKARQVQDNALEKQRQRQLSVEASQESSMMDEEEVSDLSEEMLEIVNTDRKKILERSWDALNNEELNAQPKRRSLVSTFVTSAFYADHLKEDTDLLSIKVSIWTLMLRAITWRDEQQFVIRDMRMYPPKVSVGIMEDGIELANIRLQTDNSDVNEVVSAYQPMSPSVNAPNPMSPKPTKSKSPRSIKNSKNPLKSLYVAEPETFTLHGYAMCILAPDNPIRIFFAKLVRHPMMYAVMLIVIVYSCVVSAFSSYDIRQGSSADHWLDVSDIVVCAIFTFEMALWLLADGFLLHTNAYLRSPWNILDFAIVVSSIIYTGWGTDPNSDLNVLRAFRAFRPLRLLSRFKTMRNITLSVFSSAAALSRVLIVVIIVFFAFAIIGITLFAGRFDRCEVMSPNGDSAILDFSKAECHDLMALNGSPLQDDIAIWRPPPGINFDNIGVAILTLFHLSTFEMWPQVLTFAADTYIVDLAPKKDNNVVIANIYFVCFLFVGGFFVVSLVTGVIVDKYNQKMQFLTDAHKLSDTTQEYLGLFKELAHVMPSMPMLPPRNPACCFCMKSNRAVDILEETQIAYDAGELAKPAVLEEVIAVQEANRHRCKTELTHSYDENNASAHQHDIYNEFSQGEGVVQFHAVTTMEIKANNADEEEEEEVEEVFMDEQMIAAVKRGWTQVSPFYEIRFRTLCYRIVQNPAFEPVLISIIVLNVFLMTLNWYEQPYELAYTIQVMSDVCTCLLTMEIILKAIGFGPRQYLFSSAISSNGVSSRWAWFDLFIVLFSLIPMLIRMADGYPVSSTSSTGSIGGIDPSIFRVLRIFPLLRLAHFAKGLQTVIATLAYSLPALVSVGYVLTLVFFVYSVLGMNLFGRVRPGPFLNEVANFSSFDQAFVTIMRCATGESWNGIMSDLMVEGPLCDNTVYNCGYPVIAPMFYVSFIIIVVYLVLNVFVAVIVDNFEQEFDKSEVTDDTKVSIENLVTYRNLWNDVRVAQVGKTWVNIDTDYLCNQIEAEGKRLQYSEEVIKAAIHKVAGDFHYSGLFSSTCLSIYERSAASRIACLTPKLLPLSIQPNWLPVLQLPLFLNNLPKPLGFRDEPLSDGQVIALLDRMDIRQFNGYIHYSELTLGLLQNMYGDETRNIPSHNEQFKLSKAQLRSVNPELYLLRKSTITAAQYIAVIRIQRKYRSVLLRRKFSQQRSMQAELDAQAEILTNPPLTDIEGRDTHNVL